MFPIYVTTAGQFNIDRAYNAETQKKLKETLTFLPPLYDMKDLVQ